MFFFSLDGVSFSGRFQIMREKERERERKGEKGRERERKREKEREKERKRENERERERERERIRRVSQMNCLIRSLRNLSNKEAHFLSPVPQRA